MGHFFILLPMLIIMSVLLHRAHRRDPENLYARHFRNFAWLWTSCTLIGSLAVVLAATIFADAIGLKYARVMGAAFSLPFHYIASAALVLLPFALYKKSGIVPKVIVAILVFTGIFIGSVIFVKANNLFAALGPFQGLYEAAWSRLNYIRLVAILVVLIPLGIFFFSEALRAVSPQVRIRSLLIGTGTIIIGIFGGIHVWLGPVPIGFDIAFADLVVPVGFLIIFVGLLYGRKTVSEPSETTKTSI